MVHEKVAARENHLAASFVITVPEYFQLSLRISTSIGNLLDCACSWPSILDGGMHALAHPNTAVPSINLPKIALHQTVLDLPHGIP